MTCCSWFHIAIIWLSVCVYIAKLLIATALSKRGDGRIIIIKEDGFVKDYIIITVL